MSCNRSVSKKGKTQSPLTPIWFDAGRVRSNVPTTSNVLLQRLSTGCCEIVDTVLEAGAVETCIVLILPISIIDASNGAVATMIVPLNLFVDPRDD
ncbi:hypothetical protein D3C73_1147240 [compost metagenome]